MIEARYRQVTSFGPASVGNLTVGFDLLGMCLGEPGDEVRISLCEEPTHIQSILGDHGRLPMAITENTAGIAVMSYLKHLNIGQNISLHLTKKMPLGSGMGSSGASAVAAITAVNHLFGSPLSREELCPFVLEAEGAISGSVHGDNVIPALLGGIVLITGYHPLQFKKLPVPASLYYGLVHPHLEIKTSESRKILPTEISLQTAIRQMGLLAGFIAALYESDFPSMKLYLQDEIAEPVRKTLMPYLDQSRLIAESYDAIHCGISGSGPSLFSLWDDEEAATKGCIALQKYLLRWGTASEYYTGLVNQEGATILSALKI